MQGTAGMDVPSHSRFIFSKASYTGVIDKLLLSIKLKVEGEKILIFKNVRNAGIIENSEHFYIGNAIVQSVETALVNVDGQALVLP